MRREISSTLGRNTDKRVENKFPFGCKLQGDTWVVRLFWRKKEALLPISSPNVNPSPLSTVVSSQGLNAVFLSSALAPPAPLLLLLITSSSRTSTIATLNLPNKRGRSLGPITTLCWLQILCTSKLSLALSQVQNKKNYNNPPTQHSKTTQDDDDDALLLQHPDRWFRNLSLSLSLDLDLLDMELFSSAFSQLRKRQTKKAKMISSSMSIMQQNCMYVGNSFFTVRFVGLIFRFQIWVTTAKPFYLLRRFLAARIVMRLSNLRQGNWHLCVRARNLNKYLVSYEKPTAVSVSEESHIVVFVINLEALWVFQIV